VFDNIINYPDTILRSFAPAELEKIAENCFTSKDKNYELLAIVTKEMHEYQLCPLFHAVSILEEKAIEVMIENYHCGLISSLYKSNILNYLWYAVGFSKESENSLKSIDDLEDVIIKYLKNITDSFINDTGNIKNQFTLANEFRGDVFDHINKIRENLNIPRDQKSIINMSWQEKKEKIAKIAKVLFKYTTEIEQRDLENYAKVATLAEFNSLLIERKVDLSKMDLNLPLYKILTQEPLVKGMNYNSVEDILLMRTYSQSNTLSEVKNTYSNLLKLNKISSDIMHITALNILRGDDIKIIFDPTIPGLYAPMENIVWVGSIDAKLNNAAITIHELGHYAISSLYPFGNVMPFDTSKLNLFELMPDDVYGYHLNIEGDRKSKFFEEAQNDLKKFVKYELAAKQVYIKAGELLGLNGKAFAPYILSKDTILFLKDNSPIDLFAIKLEEKMGLCDTTLSRKIAITDAYIKHMENAYQGNTCDLPSDIKMLIESDECSLSIEHYINGDLNFDEIKGFMVYQHIPFLIKYFSLNEDKVFFLERISDLASRGQDIYGCPASYTTSNFVGVKCNGDAYYQELMVRYAEFAAVGLEQELLDSFNNLSTYWQEETSPVIELLRTEFLNKQQLIDFS
jgi:hypothetical protein